MSKSKTLVGLIDRQCQIQGANGPVVVAAGKDALGVVRYSGYSEAELHAELQSSVSSHVDAGRYAQAVVIMEHLEQALANDGRIDSEEAKQLLTDAVGGAVQGLDLGAAVKGLADRLLAGWKK